MNALAQTRAVIEEGMAAGLHVGAQLFAMIDGAPAAELAMGLARPLDHPPTAMRDDTLMLWLSAGKPVTAVAIAMLVDRGLLGFDDAVSRHIPEFGQNGKEAITVRQLLTHTGGFRGLDTGFPFATWDQTLAKIYAMRLERDWVPGQRAGYHTHSSWYVLGALIERLTGEPHDAWIRREIFERLEMPDTWLALTPERYRAYGGRIGTLMDTTLSPAAPMVNLDTELGGVKAAAVGIVPGARARDLVRLYEMLRRGGELGGVRLLREQTVRTMTSRQRVGMFDATFRQTIDWGLGVIVNSSQYGPAIPYQFGAAASADTFGHGGSQSSTAFCDPARKLVAALVFNGCPGEPAHDRRLRAALKALYADLFGEVSGG